MPSVRRDRTQGWPRKLTGYKIDIKSETQAKDAPGFRYEDYLDDDEDYGLPEDIGLDDEDEDGFDGSDDEPV